MNTTSTPTPMFEHPLHALLTDLGFADGDATFDITEQDGTTIVSLRAPTGYTLEIPLPHDPDPANQLTAIRNELNMLLMGEYDLDEAAEQVIGLGCGNPQGWREMMAYTLVWVATQIARVDENGDALCKLMRLDPYAMSREDFLRGMWRSLLGGRRSILFTLMDEYLNVIDILPRMNAGDSRTSRSGFLFDTAKQEGRRR